jgi:hypothetical protein
MRLWPTLEGAGRLLCDSLPALSTVFHSVTQPMGGGKEPPRSERIETVGGLI